MRNVTKEDVEILISLQEIETAAIKIRKVLDSVESDINVRKKKRQDAEAELKALESELAEVKGLYRDVEAEVQDRNTRIAKSEEYIKNVKTNNEYQMLLREIDDNRKRNSETESQMIEYLDRMEKQEKAVLESRKRLDEIVQLTEREIAEIEKNTKSERKELESITAKRSEIASKVRPKVLERFENILKQSRGLAIVPIRNATCGGCFMNVPPQRFIEIQRGEPLNFCPQCHRMMYFKPS